MIADALSLEELQKMNQHIAQETLEARKEYQEEVSTRFIAF